MMTAIRYRIALLIAKLSIVALRITKHRGSNFPGVVALRLCPAFLRYIEKPRQIIGVTGTNGKTTVSNLLRDALHVLGKDVLNNSAGSNTATGIATALIRSVSLGGRQRYDTAVFEMDERSSRLLFPYVRPDWLLVTNLSRDSIMRNGHPEFIRGILERYMPQQTKLLLNADDLLSAFLSPENDRRYYGIDALPGDKTSCRNLIDDCQICPRCHGALIYERNRYSNIGRARCERCDFRSPEPEFLATDVDFESMHMSVRFGEGGSQESFRLLDRGIFNIYNELSVLAMLHVLGYALPDIHRALKNIAITKTRYDVCRIGSITLRAMLCKDRNAYAVSRVLEYIAADPAEKEILLYCNNFEDARTWSENTCWLYDCDFELLADESVRRIITAGDRGMDYKLRLLTAGVPEERIRYVRDPFDGVTELGYTEGETIYLLYGTDAFTPAPAVKKKILEKLEALDLREEASDAD